MTSVSIVDYGMGNIYSISNAVRQLGFQPNVIKRPEEVTRSDKLILPGVGAYRDAMRVLTEMHLCEALRNFVLSGRHFLGICLGMQLLLESSEENGGVSGLGFVNGEVRRFSNEEGYKIPQIQWNEVSWPKGMKMFAGIPDGSMFYFLHSFYCQSDASGLVSAQSEYAGIQYSSAFQRENIWATQFHPEKSGELGLELIRNFLLQE